MSAHESSPERRSPAGESLTQPLRSRRNHWNNWVATHAQRTPDAAALRFLGADTTWRQLDERSTSMAAALSRRGVGFGDRVLLLTLNRPEFFEAVLAINALGALAVPVNFRLTPPEVAYIVRDSGATVVFTEPTLAPLVAAVRQHVPELGLVVNMGAPTEGDVLGYEELIEEGAEVFEPLDIPEDTPALILYTSGTTGSPKGAVLTHTNMASQAVTCIRAMRYDRGDDIGFLASPVFHVAALGSVAPMLMLGNTTVIHPLKAFDPGEMLDAWERDRVTTVFLVPVQWQAVCADPTVSQRDLALRVISWGAAPASDTVLRAMAETFSDALIVAVFGQTEMSPITCVLDGDDAIRKLGSVGKPIPTIQTRIVDDQMNDVAPGAVGEIVYRGPTMMLEYWQNPAATADAFAGGWFHSGDLVRQDEEGFVYVVDRKKDMIISGGENIYCAEVENALFAHPAVREAAVVGRADPKWTEVPVAVVALEEGASELSVEDLSAWLDDKLARYKHPKDVVLVDALPRNASGKVVKVELRKQHGVDEAAVR
ncbi:long-chain-fatty-acid--CoA ligase [Rhodococcus triatomae]|uniref:Fatty-acyl-CoA synthase n=1 Tax=Rhodococcus triatomae TaxID=300028 RepID=A0A1G8JQN1_9NOCA|nr:fatty-acid--CoA ligase FadD5 [Rhodococcus triatomae]QNG19660.1 long-chain-fatty-acid--CoA ligase [Rhodococcus triatomae]QNG24425.1 long-chain-fatty-acid--CoA ligase [Rhodococcus triatomae]SDI33411.1 fatty-acyl-CoA synthase [Rhodococcus triatomae]